jgi:hypothetical protein
VGLGRSVFSGAGLFVLRVDELGLFIASGSNATSSSGLLATSGDGLMFTLVTTPVPTAPFGAITYNSASGRLIASGGSQIFVSEVGSPTGWTAVTTSQSARTFCWVNGSHVFASDSSGTGAFSTNGGMSWPSIPIAVGGGSSVGACIWDQNKSIAYIGGQTSFTPIRPQMIRSVDFFATWQTATNVFTTSGPDSFLFFSARNLFLAGGEQTSPQFVSASSMGGTYSASSGGGIGNWVYQMVEATSTIVGNVGVTRSVTISGAVSIKGNLAANATVTMSPQASIAVSGATTFAQLLVFKSGAAIATGALVLPASSILHVVLAPHVNPTKKRDGAVVVTVATYAPLAVTGTFSAVTAESDSVDSSCLLAQADHGSTTLSVTITLSTAPGCVPANVTTTGPATDTGLSAGAIAGIVIGCVVAGALIAIGVVAISRCRKKRREVELRRGVSERQVERADTAIHL